MRAVLIVNPNATSTTAAGRDLLAHALESRVELTVVHTARRGHAVDIAAAAARDGIDALIVHGGDGTVSEVVNGMLGRPGAAPPPAAPAVAVVPGGAANVFARSLGIDNDPLIATNQLVGLLDEHRRTGALRRIGLMDCGERWAIFNAGLGADGEVVAAVEARRDRGRKVTAARYIRTAVPILLRSARRDPALELRIDGADPVPPVHFVFVCNSSPWTFAGSRPIWTNPDTTFEGGLGVFATTGMNVVANLRLARQMFAKRPRLVAGHLVRDDDAAAVRVRCPDGDVASQIDGDYIGRRADMAFRAVPDALSVIAPPRPAVNVAAPSPHRRETGEDDKAPG